MDEDIFISLLAESTEREWDSYENAPEHVFSKKHDRAMKRIFKLYDKNTADLRNTSAAVPVKTKFLHSRKAVLIVAAMIFLALITGFTAAYIITGGFRGQVHKDNTALFPINNENCPETIEKTFYLTNVPDDYEIISTVNTPFFANITYQKSDSDQTFLFSQCVKTSYSAHYNTEQYDLEEIEISGNKGICLDLSDDNTSYCAILWDNGEYILEIVAYMPKNEVIALAESVKLKE